MLGSFVKYHGHGGDVNALVIGEHLDINGQPVYDIFDFYSATVLPNVTEGKIESEKFSFTRFSELNEGEAVKKVDENPQLF